MRWFANTDDIPFHLRFCEAFFLETCGINILVLLIYEAKRSSPITESFLDSETNI